jgi:transcriptional regulator with XRE-family HTH domain
MCELMPKAQHAARYRRLPALLRQMRADAGLTQRDLAAKLGISHVAVHKCETGDRRVDVAEFADWASACRVDPLDAFRRFAGGGRAKA